MLREAIFDLPFSFSPSSLFSLSRADLCRSRFKTATRESRFSRKTEEMKFLLLFLLLFFVPLLFFLPSSVYLHVPVKRCVFAQCQTKYSSSDTVPDSRRIMDYDSFPRRPCPLIPSPGDRVKCRRIGQNYGGLIFPFISFFPPPRPSG